MSDTTDNLFTSTLRFDPTQPALAPDSTEEVRAIRSSPLDLCCFSLNCNKTNYVSHAILNSIVDSTDICLMQEPWFGKIGLSRSDDSGEGIPVFGLINNRAWSQHRVHKRIF